MAATTNIEAARIRSGVVTSRIILPAGSDVSGGVPAKFNSGPLATGANIVAGNFEFYDGRWYITGTAKQRVIDRTGGVIVASTEVVNTSVETTLWTESISANAMRAGRIYKLHADGITTNATNGDDLTLNVYFGSTLVGTLTPATATFSNTQWELNFNVTVRTTGAGGTAASNGSINIGTVNAVTATLPSIDTTAINTITVKAKWNNAKAGNSVSIYQGWLELKN
jgi:hypothetical protein